LHSSGVNKSNLFETFLIQLDSNMYREHKGGEFLAVLFRKREYKREDGGDGAS